jgi:anti-anti-sigma regulatory factor
MALRITVEANEETMVVKLEGRIAGPWVAELDRLWAQTSPSLASRRVSLDLRETTYADAGGIRVLRAIYSQTEAAILTSTPWTQYLADEVTRKSDNQSSPEAQNANRA